MKQTGLIPNCAKADLWRQLVMSTLLAGGAIGILPAPAAEKPELTPTRGAAAVNSQREAMAERIEAIEAKIGREGLTLADQLRGARELRQRLWNDPQRPRYHLMPPDGF